LKLIVCPAKIVGRQHMQKAGRPGGKGLRPSSETSMVKKLWDRKSVEETDGLPEEKESYRQRNSPADKLQL
jgi:hypothetical protein